MQEDGQGILYHQNMGNCIRAHKVDSHSSNPPTSKTSSSEDMPRTSFRPSYVVEKENKGGSPMDRAMVGGRDRGFLDQSNHQGITINQRRMPPPRPSGRIVKPNLRRYTYDELKMATRNFRPDTILGEGGFGRVFKGWVDRDTYKPSKVGVGIPVAVKKSNPDSLQGIEEWQAEVSLLGKFSHPNLVRLIGHCWEEKEYLLVYEYMEKGSLENHLFQKAAEPLTWETRLNIAIGAARGLDFLHTSEKSVIYRDFKSSNVLLDGNYNAKLSDFGIAKVGPDHGRSHVTTRVLGTYGYAAPEYIATGHLYLKSDVYGFGVVLLEILTGLRAMDNNRPSGEHILVEWVKPFLTEKKKIKKLMDPRLGGQYPISGAVQLAQLILTCLESDPKNRPSMEGVLDSLEKIFEIKGKPKDSRASSAVRQTSDKAGHRAAHRHRQSPYHHNNSSSNSKYRAPHHH